MGMKTFSPLQQNDICVVSAGCCEDANTDDWVGVNRKSSPLCGDVRKGRGWEDMVRVESPIIGQKATHLVPSEERGAIRGPSQGIGVPKPLDFIDAGLGSDIPDFNDTIVADTCEFCVLDRVEGNLFDCRSMSFQLGRETHIGPFWIPWKRDNQVR
jgi:hypothetical protein